MISPRLLIASAAAAAALALAGCATRPFTGPVEVTRFVAEAPTGLGQGPIHVYFPDEIANPAVKAAFKAAVERELRGLGYMVVAQEGRGIQVASVRTSREPIASSAPDQRGNVNVGIGGGGGFGGGPSFGGGGVGVGVNLGGGREGPAAMTELSVRIADDRGTALWEGRAQLVTGIKSPYSQIEASAGALSAGLFRDFPGGSGETVSIRVRDLKPKNVAAQ